MSYSVTIPTGPFEDFGERLNAAVEAANIERQNEAATVPVHAAVLAMRDLATQVAGEGQYVGATLNGHANPGRQDTPGYVRDSMTINIFRTAAPSPTE